jgi:hypothetical protein
MSRFWNVLASPLCSACANFSVQNTSDTCDNVRGQVEIALDEEYGELHYPGAAIRVAECGLRLTGIRWACDRRVQRYPSRHILGSPDRFKATAGRRCVLTLPRALHAGTR